MIVILLVVTAALVVPFLLHAAQLPPPLRSRGTPLFEARQLAADRFASPAHRMVFVVEARGGDLLRKAPLLELWRNAATLRADPSLGRGCSRYPHPVTGAEVQGLSTVADAVDGPAARRRRGGPGRRLAGADRRGRGSAARPACRPTKLGLSVQARRDPASGRWRSPALLVAVLADNAALGGGGDLGHPGRRLHPKEAFAREVLRLLRGEQRHLRAWGLAMDVNLTSMEQGRAAGPFIGLTIFAALMLVGLIFRSYWAVATVGFALGSLMLWLKGLTNLVGLKEDQILSIIVPIAMISFGVDFAFHALGRYREERAAAAAATRGAALIGRDGRRAGRAAAGHGHRRARPFCPTPPPASSPWCSSAWRAALATVASFVMLGLFVPLALMRIESAGRVSRVADRWRRRSGLGGAVVGRAARHGRGGVSWCSSSPGPGVAAARWATGCSSCWARSGC